MNIQMYAVFGLIQIQIGYLIQYGHSVLITCTVCRPMRQSIWTQTLKSLLLRHWRGT